MRIACLQFAPQVGDIDNNLNRADAVLNRANPQDLDLLVLPELAFSGCNFKSLEAIGPYLEHTGSGITSLWARTIALKHGCVVVAGYPEKVPARLECYNSALAVNADGETIVNYRKSFLDASDKRWASEGRDVFFNSGVRGLGHIALGIGMDINPYNFKAPWMAWEFAYHVLHKQANLVIILMAWLTPQNLSVYSANSKDPDMEILAYWIARLEPLVRAEDEGEIIVVLANRCGTEGEATYAGTSCVLGVEDGEVKVYGVLGRGDKELLVIDTSEPPQYNLIANPETHKAPAKAYNRLADRDSRDPDTAEEGQGLMGSIDAVLAQKSTDLGNQDINGLYTSSTHVNAEITRFEEIPANARSSLTASDSQSPSTSISSSIASSVYEIKGLSSADSRTNHFDRLTAPKELPKEMIQISLPEDLVLGIYGPRNDYPPVTTSSVKINTSCEPGPSVSRSEDIHHTPIVNNSRRVVPIVTKQDVYSPDSHCLPDSGYPSNSAYPLESAYPPDSGLPTDSACPPDSAYPLESASSTTVNVPWEQERTRRYYGDDELIKVMKVATPDARNYKHKLNPLPRPFLSPMDNQTESTSPPDSAYPHDSAYPPESASSTTVNAPWSPESDRRCYEDKELIETGRLPAPSKISNARNESTSIPQFLVSSDGNQTGFAYLPDSASLPESSYPPESAASMIVNVPWEPQPKRSYYGDEELLKVMKPPAQSGVSNSSHGSNAATQPSVSSPEDLLDLASSETFNKATLNLIDFEARGVTEMTNYETSARNLLSPTGNSPESASSMRVNMSSFQDPSRSDSGKEGTIQIMANPRAEISSGHTSFESTKTLLSSKVNQPESVVSLREHTGFGPNAAEPVVSETDIPPEPSNSAIVNTGLEPSLAQPVATQAEEPPDSACSIMFNIPFAPSPGLFPGEDFVSPIATSKASSSEHMSFPTVQPPSSSADLLQSPMSDRSVKYSDNSPLSPESASSVFINPSWEASPMFSAIEEFRKLAESPNSPVANRRSHGSRPFAELESPRRQRPYSPKLWNEAQTSDLQGNVALLFEELVNHQPFEDPVDQSVIMSADNPAEVIQVCVSPHLMPEPMTNAINSASPILPSFHIEDVQDSSRRHLTPSPVIDSPDHGGLRIQSLRALGEAAPAGGIPGEEMQTTFWDNEL